MKKENRNTANEYQQLMKIATKHYNNEEFEEALDLYLKAQEMKPSAVEVLNKLGEVYCCLDDFDSAIESFKKVIELHPDEAEGYFNLGVVYDQNEDFQLAIDAFKKAAELDPTDADAFFNIGTGYDFLDDMDDAEVYYKKALEIRPRMKEAAHNIAIIYMQRATDALELTDPDYDSISNVYKEGYKYMEEKQEFFDIMEHSVLPLIKDKPASFAIYQSVLKEIRNPREKDL